MDFQFPTKLQELQYLLHYSRYDHDLGRRETYLETVDRVVNYLRELAENASPGAVPERDFVAIQKHMLALDVMPSMRLVAMAGDAARRDQTSIYNCCYLSVSSLESFADALSILMAGCGVGYSVEAKFVKKLPAVKKAKTAKQAGNEAGPIIYYIEDSAKGWSDAFLFGLKNWFNGWFGEEIFRFDYSQLRPKGSVLRVKGGRASGPEVLQELLDFTRNTILAAQGRRLTPLECHDIMCMIGKCVVSGGVRRSALIALFDEHDEAMLTCKDNINWETGEHAHRAYSNNSAVWTGRKSRESIQQYVELMHAGRNGEPGIVSRYAMKATMQENARFVERSFSPDMGTNPCGEITLNDNQFCNLSICVARPDDTLGTLVEKVRVATIIGTIQSTAIHFPFLHHRDQFVHNSRRERLLGVDITGQMDSEAARDPRTQRMLKKTALETNALYAQKLHINAATSVTCVKPSGNSSVFLDCAPGLHARYAPFYIRRVRVSDHSPVAHLLIDQGMPYDVEGANLVFAFPVAAPAGAITQDERGALEQLEYWKQVKLNYTTHNPSCTITYADNELDTIAEWLYNNQEIIGGLSFLPKSDIVYSLPPYEAISEEQHAKMVAAMPEIDLSKLPLYEAEDNTTLANELACVSGLCEI